MLLIFGFLVKKKPYRMTVKEAVFVESKIDCRKFNRFDGKVFSGSMAVMWSHGPSRRGEELLLQNDVGFQGSSSTSPPQQL